MHILSMERLPKIRSRRAQDRGKKMVNHDRLFKLILSSFFAEFMDLFFPECSEYMDRESIVLLDKEIFTDLKMGETHEADLVIRVKYKERESYFLVHAETQAQEQEEFPKRMFRYFCRLSEKHDLPVYPIAVFSFDTPFKEQPDAYEVCFDDLPVLAFKYRVVQLNRMDWRKYLKHENPVAAALTAKMHIAERDRPRVKLECLRLLWKLKRNQAEIRLISEFIDTYLSLTANEVPVYETLRGKLESEEREAVMEVETGWKREGIKEGLEKGRLEGRLEIITRQLRLRVGKIDGEAEALIRGLSAGQLDSLSEALLDFSKTADLTGWLESHTLP
jgi:predicted transposase/invertase (TIGR01784 family)